MQVINRAVYLGRLMSPQEVQAATSQRMEIPDGIRSCWYLCGDITEELWYAINNSSNINKGFCLNALTRHDGGSYVIFTFQLRDMQCRFLLSVRDKKVINFLDNAQKTGIWLSLGRDDGNQAILQPFLLSPEHLRPISDFAKSCNVMAPEEALVDFRLAAFEVIKPVTVPSILQGFEIRQVSLSIITSD
jgi:hypothetical protein